MVRDGFIESDAALARVLGVSRPAIRDAEARGRICRAPDGSWNLINVVADWRAHTDPRLQRPARGREFRPWLDAELPLAGSILTELLRRAAAARPPDLE